MASSAFRMGQGLVQARISPRNSTPSGSGSHLNHHSNHHPYARSFFASACKAPQGNLTSPKAPVQEAVVSNTGECIRMDGINVTQLRQLATSCSGNSNSSDTTSTTSSPGMAVFYASMVYAKTQSPQDAFVYAKTLFHNHEAKRCVKLLETTNLFRSQDTLLAMESVLLAAQALASLEEWNMCCVVLEDMTSFYANGNGHGHGHGHGHHAHSLEDDDDIGWQAWKDSIPHNRHHIHPLSRVCCFRGQAYAEMGHPLRAGRFWKLALMLDPLCVQALDFMLERSVVNPQQALQVVLQLDFAPDFHWLRALYLARVHTTDSRTQQDTPITTTTTTTAAAAAAAAAQEEQPPFWQEASSIQLLTPSFQQSSTTNAGAVPNSSFFGSSTAPPISQIKAKITTTTTTTTHNDNVVPQPQEEDALDALWNTHKLQKSPEVLALRAKRAYQSHQLPQALKYCQALKEVDPLSQTAGLVYVATLVALKQKRLLFQLAHEWVDASPKSSKAWFAVGAYYFACGKYHAAQRHFCRSTRLDPHSREAWIAFGTSFAACDESDQALASYRAAQRLAPGDYTSLLYIGMEYLRTNHLVLAEHFLGAGWNSSQQDPLCANELGVLNMAQKKYEQAIDWFLQALGGTKEDLETCLESITDVYWEPTIFNLAQAYRKTRQLSHAVQCLQRCLSLQESASAHAALGFCLHLSGDYDGAIDHYHTSLSKQPESAFCSEMLQRGLGDALNQGMTIMGDVEDPGLPPTAVAATAMAGLPTNNHQNQSTWSEGTGLSISVEDDSQSSDVDMG